MQFNYLMDKGAFAPNADGTFTVDFAKIKAAVRDLTHDLLTIEATGRLRRREEDAGHAGVMRPADAARARRAGGHPDRHRTGIHLRPIA